jgi:hypothetical protein
MYSTKTKRYYLRYYHHEPDKTIDEAEGRSAAGGFLFVAGETIGILYHRFTILTDRRIGKNLSYLSVRRKSSFTTDTAGISYHGASHATINHHNHNRNQPYPLDGGGDFSKDG